MRYEIPAQGRGNLKMNNRRKNKFNEKRRTYPYRISNPICAKNSSEYGTQTANTFIEYVSISHTPSFTLSFAPAHTGYWQRSQYTYTIAYVIKSRNTERSNSSFFNSLLCISFHRFHCELWVGWFVFVRAIYTCCVLKFNQVNQLYSNLVRVKFDFLLNRICASVVRARLLVQSCVVFHFARLKRICRWVIYNYTTYYLHAVNVLVWIPYKFSFVCLIVCLIVCLFDVCLKIIFHPLIILFGLLLFLLLSNVVFVIISFQCASHYYLLPNNWLNMRNLNGVQSTKKNNPSHHMNAIGCRCFSLC